MGGRGPRCVRSALVEEAAACQSADTAARREPATSATEPHSGALSLPGAAQLSSCPTDRSSGSRGAPSSPLNGEHTENTVFCLFSTVTSGSVVYERLWPRHLALGSRRRALQLRRRSLLHSCSKPALAQSSVNVPPTNFLSQLARAVLCRNLAGTALAQSANSQLRE